MCVGGVIPDYIKSKGEARAEVSGEGHGGPHSKQVWFHKKPRPKFGGHKAKSKRFLPLGKLMTQRSHPTVVGGMQHGDCLWARAKNL